MSTVDPEVLARYDQKVAAFDHQLGHIIDDARTHADQPHLLEDLGIMLKDAYGNQPAVLALMLALAIKRLAAQS